MKIPYVPEWMTAKDEYVEVACDEVEFARVILPNVVAPVKALLPLKVLLLARSVDDAAAIALLQPKVPLV